jgi:hypothetical protein
MPQRIITYRLDLRQTFFNFGKSNNMLSIQGIYDGKNIYPVEAIKGNKKYKVIITFVEELDLPENEHTELRNFGTNEPALDFWNNSKEDIYQDYLPTAHPE